MDWIKYFSHTVVCCFGRMKVCFGIQWFFSHEVLFLKIDHSATAIRGFLFCKTFLVLWIQDYSPPLLLLSVSEYFVLCWGLWLLWSWVFWRVVWILLHSSKWRRTIWPATYVENSSVHFWFLCQKSHFHWSRNLYLLI